MSAHSSTRLVKKPRRSFTTELAKELSSPLSALKVAGVAAEIPVPMVATHEVTSDVSTPIAVTPETISEVVSVTSEPDIIIVTSLGTGVIPSPSVMVREWQLLVARQPNCCLLVSSTPNILFFCHTTLSLCNVLNSRCRFTVISLYF